MSSTAWWDIERDFREATAASARVTESGGIGRPERTTLRYWSSSFPKERSQLIPPLSYTSWPTRPAMRITSPCRVARCAADARAGHHSTHAMIAPVAQQWEGPEPHGLGPSPIVCCPSAHPCCAGDARGSGSRAGAVSIGGVHAAPRPLPGSVTDALHACSTRSAREALHPLRRDTPDPSRCTRSEGV